MRKRYDFAAFRLPLSKVGTITATRIIALRDSVLGSQIEGSEPGSKICTSTFGAEFRSAKLPNNATPFYELRGLWETTGTSMMAGPFVAHIYPDQKNNILYYVEGFVYHPNEKKRNIIRNLQAALFSFRPDSIDEYEPEEIKKVQWGKIEKINNEVTSHTVTDNTDL